MAFPLTHLCVAQKILQKSIGTDSFFSWRNQLCNAQFLLGSIAPDAVHYRAEFTDKKSIGATKKITHLCPVSDERWGHVTDNDGWIECAKKFLRTPGIPSPSFVAGYVTHCLTDLWNNKTIWDEFRTNHPEEAAKGYASEYYNELHNIDAQLWFEYPDVAEIMQTLAKSTPEGISGLVSADEVAAIRDNLLHEHFKNAAYEKGREYKFVTYEDTLKFIDDAAEFTFSILSGRN
ncbi:MAG: hypothetical protein FWC70_04235 [Defluviitaleaceae bacterium]|nr:hypothetical protein [Defluviitaleaceae bacterium]